MPFLLPLFLKLGLSDKLAKIASYAVVVLFVLLALWWLRHDAYRDGARATDAKWQIASQKLQDRAQASATVADVKHAEVVAKHDDAVAKEKEKLDQAERNGTSPFDVLFGN